MSTAALPAAPLAVLVDRHVERLLVNESPTSAARGFAYQRLTVCPRVIFAWRNNPRACVSFAVADRVLSRSPYLWFDVWPECQYHAAPALGCTYCHTHYRARELFTGAEIPREMRRPK